MLIAVKGYYDGKQIVMDEDIKMAAGQRVIVTILDAEKAHQKKVDLRKYMGRGEKMFHKDAQEYVKGLRNNDRVYKGFS